MRACRPSHHAAAASLIARGVWVATFAQASLPSRQTRCGGCTRVATAEPTTPALRSTHDRAPPRRLLHVADAHTLQEVGKTTSN